MSENLIERYLTDMGEVRGTGSNVAETSFYPALERLLSDIGKSLSPKVRCVINLANRGAGLPDGGLFSADQFDRQTRDADAKKNPFLVQIPSRGVIEAKPPAEDVHRVAETEQVERYWKWYGMVLVTNFRAFALIGKGPAGQPSVLESFALAESESEFWRLTAHPRPAAARQGERMLEYLKRVLLHNAPLAAPQDVAGLLASYAHDARLRIELADLPALTSLRQALEDALGLRFEGEKGEHFFRSTLIQTLFIRYQVERVDAVLRSELGLADGLADPKVVVLDPCCGTGAYVRAVLRRIAATLHDKGGDALVANDLKKAAMERVFGFEILPAPFVIAHLQLGLELETLGAPLSDRCDPPERAGVYLTNALTGWEPPQEKPKQIAFPGFDDERDAAGKVKQEKPILVILGNPPYNAFAGVSPEEEHGLVEPYKKGLISEWGIKKFNLDDLYIRFFRLAEKRIAEHGGRGVVSFISNFSYLSDPSYRIVGPEARRKVLREFRYDESRIVRYPFKPLDVRWCYLENLRPLFSEPSPQLLDQRFPGNVFFVTRDTADKDPEGPPFFFSPVVCDYDCISGHARHFPLRLKASRLRRAGNHALGNHTLPGMETESEKITANLSPVSRAYLASLGLPNPDNDQTTAELIWYHALAIGYSPAYLAENADGIRQDWPRIPLPKAKDSLLASAALGRQVAALLDTEAPVPGVTAGKIPDDLRHITVFQRLDGKPAKPEAGDLDLTAGWGHGGKGGVTMPGRGKSVPHDDGSLDVFLNEIACWRNVPEAVWNYTIGGYQVIKKWLSYREKPLLGRSLTPDEVRYVTEIARRLAALIALQPALDANYRSVTKETYSLTNH